MIHKVSSLTAAAVARYDFRGGSIAAITSHPDKIPFVSSTTMSIGSSTSAIPSTSSIPKSLRFFISGNIGSVIFFFIERMIYLLLCQFKQLPSIIEVHKEGVSFFVSYLLQVVPQHWLHAVLVYGRDTISTRAKYFHTLMCQYSVYACSMFGSTFLNALLVKVGIHRTIAFFGTILTFAFVNYFLIEWTIKRDLRSAEKLKSA